MIVLSYTKGSEFNARMLHSCYARMLQPDDKRVIHFCDMTTITKIGSMVQDQKNHHDYFRDKMRFISAAEKMIGIYFGHSDIYAKIRKLDVLKKKRESVAEEILKVPSFNKSKVNRLTQKLHKIDLDIQHYTKFRNDVMVFIGDVLPTLKQDCQNTLDYLGDMTLQNGHSVLYDERKNKVYKVYGFCVGDAL